MTGDGDTPRCGCGCRQVWEVGDRGWHCPHCDLPPAQQPEALIDALDHLPPEEVRG